LRALARPDDRERAGCWCAAWNDVALDLAYSYLFSFLASLHLYFVVVLLLKNTHIARRKSPDFST